MAGWSGGFVVRMSLTLLPITFCRKHSLISPTTEGNISFAGDMSQHVMLVTEKRKYISVKSWIMLITWQYNIGINVTLCSGDQHVDTVQYLGITSGTKKRTPV